MRYGESAPEIIARVKAKIAEVQKAFRAGVRIVPAYDRSALIARRGEHSQALADRGDPPGRARPPAFPDAFPLGAHRQRAAADRRPDRLSSLMRVFGITSNIMSLMGIAIAIGVLVDAGIVITENCFRQIERDGERGRTAAPADRFRARRRRSRSAGRSSFRWSSSSSPFSPCSRYRRGGTALPSPGLHQDFRHDRGHFSFGDPGAGARDLPDPGQGASGAAQPADARRPAPLRAAPGWALRHPRTTLLGAGAASSSPWSLVGGAGLLLRR